MDSAHPVSYLQELMAKQRKDLPLYSFEATASNSAHNKFICKLQVDGLEAIGTGANKQTAKYEAAKQALDKLRNSRKDNGQSLYLPPNPNEDLSAKFNYNPIGKLNEITAQKRMSYPSYTERGMDEKNQFIISCQIGDKATTGKAPTKKNAKQAAAHHMLQLLNGGTYKSVDVPKEPANFPDDDYVINKFVSMSLANEVKHETDGTKIKLPYVSPVHTVKKEEYTQSTEDMLFELQTMNVNYDTEVVQKDPYILVMKLDDDRGSVMEMGETYDEAFFKALKATLKSVKMK